jgi:NTP pyrophosphatase (non-canonical NTP hydrolase)
MGIGKTIVIAAAALLLGIFIGGLGPRAELAETKVALQEAEARGKQGGGASLPLALGLGSLAAARERANQAEAGPRRVPRFVAPDTAPGEPRPDAGRSFRFGDPETFAAAKAAGDVRAAQFRAAFIDEAKLPASAAQHLDATVKGMNEELGRAADEIAKELAARHQGDSKITPRELADVGARVLDIYRSADDKWKAGLDESGRAAAGKSDFDLLTQIDVGVFERLSQTLQTMDRPTLRAP